MVSFNDHGKNFRLSKSLNLPGSNEAMAAELPDGKIIINARNQKGEPRSSIVSLSSTGGESWNTTYYDSNLIDPVCQGSILSLRLKANKTALAVCNNADLRNRDRLTLRISFDQGQSWKKYYLIGQAPSGYKGDFTAYSDLVQIDKMTIGVLYEFDDYKQILFKPVSIK